MRAVPRVYRTKSIEQAILQRQQAEEEVAFGREGGHGMVLWDVGRRPYAPGPDVGAAARAVTRIGLIIAWRITPGSPAASDRPLRSARRRMRLFTQNTQLRLLTHILVWLMAKTSNLAPASDKPP